MFGPQILARSLSIPAVIDRHGNSWNYHSRSDRHSKLACWSAVLDLLAASPLLRKHASERRVAFGINHEMRDFERNRKKNLDLVLCTPAPGADPPTERLFADLVSHYSVSLTDVERKLLSDLPVLYQAPVGSVLLALEAKACMTAHQRALPRLYDELNSSHLTVHGASDHAIAGGFVMINTAERFLSADLNKANRPTAPIWNNNAQPKSTLITIEKVLQLPRRTRAGIPGFDALAAVLVNCPNDGSDVSLVTKPPAPQAGDLLNYASAVERIANLYGTRFSEL